MSFETIVNGKIKNSQNLPVNNIAVELKIVKEQNTITGYRSTSIIATSSTDSNGLVQFSGVTAGLYDIVVSGTYNLYNYAVKNEFIVPEGGSEVVREGRKVVRSEESSSVLFSKENRPNVQLGYPMTTFTETVSGVGTVTNTFTNRLDDSLFSETLQLQVELDDRYIVQNQSTKLFQSFTFKLPV